MQIVIWPQVEPTRLAAFEAAAPEIQVRNAATLADAATNMPTADAFFGKLTADLLAASRRLRWVQAPTASLEHYLFPELVEHPCELTNMRGIYADVVADHALGMILAFARQLHTYIRQQAKPVWQAVGGEAGRSDFAAGPGVTTDLDRAHRHLADDTLGIVGLGHIGRALADRAKAVGLRVLAVDPVATPSPAVEQVWRLDRLDDLLAASDYVVLAAPHTPATQRLIRRGQLQRMKPTAYLINVGRGALLDLDDLTAALRQGELAGAGLDVFDVEPLPLDHPLWGFSNTILTPHVAGVSPRIAQRHLQVVLDNLSRFVRGEPLLNLVDKRAWF